MAKTATIRIRIKPEDKERFEKAAREAEVTLSAWMIFAGKEKLRLSEALEGERAMQPTDCPPRPT